MRDLFWLTVSKDFSRSWRGRYGGVEGSRSMWHRLLNMSRTGVTGQEGLSSELSPLNIPWSDKMASPVRKRVSKT